MASKTKIAHKVSINLSVDTVHDRLMDIFAGHMEEKERANLHFEIACGDIFQDVTKATSAIEKLRKLGFGVIVDGLTLELLPYVRVNKFDTDLIKIHLGRHDVRMLGDDACIKAIRRLQLDKLVFSRCDHDGAIKIGETLNIRMYQGWLIDEQAMTAQAAPMAPEAATRYN
jgi:EAL domain-containing protein (putative c-di-GMP-specific phosphodiesterase class I)